MEAVSRMEVIQDIAIRIHQTQKCNRDQTLTEGIQDKTGIQIRDTMDEDVVEDKAEAEVRVPINTTLETPQVVLFLPLEIPEWDRTF